MNEESTQPAAQTWLTAVTYFSILVLFFVINVKMIAPYILSILTGAVFAIILFPLYTRLVRHRLNPYLASGIITIAMVLTIIVPLSLFTIAAVTQAVSIGQHLLNQGVFSIDWVIGQIGDWRLVRLFEDGDQLRTHLIQIGERGIQTATKFLLNILTNIPDSALLLVLALLSCFFLLVDGKRLLVFLSEKIQLDPDVRNNLQISFRDTAISVVWATVAAAGVQAILVLLSFLILNIPGAFLAGGATFIFAWIPFVGAAPVWVSGVIYLFFQDRNTAMIVMIILGIFISLIDNYIRPWVLKGRNELHPLVSLVAIFGGIRMFGLLGVFFGPVFAAVLITLIQILPTVAKRFGLRFVSIKHVPKKESR